MSTLVSFAVVVDLCGGSSGRNLVAPMHWTFVTGLTVNMLRRFRIQEKKDWWRRNSGAIIATQRGFIRGTQLLNVRLYS